MRADRGRVPFERNTRRGHMLWDKVSEIFNFHMRNSKGKELSSGAGAYNAGLRNNSFCLSVVCVLRDVRYID